MAVPVSIKDRGAGKPAKPTRTETIADVLARRIIGGEYPPGERLPTERHLAEGFGTTRNVIREALKRLEANGLVTIRHGSGIYAENPQFASGVELFDVLMMGEDGVINAAYLRDVLEFRGWVFRFMVRLAALRRTDQELQTLQALLHARAQNDSNPAQLDELTRQLFREIARATHNQVCILLYNTVERVSMRIRALVDLPAVSFEQSQQVIERILDAFTRRDGTLAELIVLRYVQATSKFISLDTIQDAIICTDDMHE